MCHERSINCVLNSSAPAPSRQLNTTNCRATATFLSLTLLIQFLDCQKWADTAEPIPPSSHSLTSGSGSNRASDRSNRAARALLAEIAADARDEILPRPRQKLGDQPGEPASLRSNRCWPVLRSLCFPACRFSRSRFGPRRPLSAIWEDSSRSRPRRVCPLKL